MPKSKQQPQYEAEDIYVLEGLEPVRKRPGMYIGSTGTDGLHHLVWEVVDNGIDEAMAGYCDQVFVILHPKQAVTVIDDGRGIPVSEHPQTKKSALETVMTTLHAGGKFGDKSYKVAGGLHGVGVSVVCALSSWLKATVIRDKKVYTQSYKQGIATSKLKKLGSNKKVTLKEMIDSHLFKGKDGKARLKTLEKEIPQLASGTLVSFIPDWEIFSERKFKWKKILDHLRQQAYLTRGLRINVLDQRLTVKPRKYNFYFDGGIKSYVRYLNWGETPTHQHIFYVRKKHEDILVEVALQYSEDLEGMEIGFANNINTPEGGMHLTGFKKALTRAVNEYAKKEEFIGEGESNLVGRDVREGLTAVVSVKLKEPQFEGQTKAKLGNPEARTAVEKVVYDKFLDFLAEHPTDARQIINKVLLARKARRAAKKAKETVIRKGALTGLSLPGKLADCSARDPAKAELFIVEGDSAGGSSKMARDRTHQAVLPIRGKILNVEKARLNRVLANKEIKALIVALGTAIAEEFDLTKLRYNKIIIMTDADVDGAHIRTLLLTLFYRYFRPVIETGHLYIVEPPLYRIKTGKKVFYAYNEAEREEITGKLEKENKRFTQQRFKGLGEMTPQQLWETSMDKETRMLKQVTIEDAQEADRIFDGLMGKDVAPRKKFLKARAKEVENLDI